MSNFATMADGQGKVEDLRGKEIIPSLATIREQQFERWKGMCTS